MKFVRETKCYWFLYVDDSSFVFKYHKNTFKTKVIKVKNIDLVNGKYDIDYSFEGVNPIIIKEI